MTMVLPGEKQLTRGDDVSAGRRVDWRAGGAQEIGSGVRAPGFTVEDAPRSEAAVRHVGNRTLHSGLPGGLACRVSIHRGHELGFIADSCEQIRGGFT
jgi:hypothetical protein